MNDTPNIKPIELSPFLRVRDYDVNQYVIERRSVVQTGEKAGDVVWTVVAYHGAVESIPGSARQFVVGDIVSEARRAAEAAFDASGLAETLSALPPKTGKKETGE